MATLRVVLGDQLSSDIAALTDYRPGDVVLMAEVDGECRYVRHHARKLVLVLSAMRHFAAALAGRGIAVDYVRLDDPANTHSLGGEVARAVRRHRPGAVIATEPGEWRVLADMRAWATGDAPPGASFVAGRSFGPGRRANAAFAWSSSIARCVVATRC